MNLNKKFFSYADICEILDCEIKKTIDRKIKYIQLNGADAAAMSHFEATTATLTHLYWSFKESARSREPVLMGGKTK